MAIPTLWFRILILLFLRMRRGQFEQSLLTDACTFTQGRGGCSTAWPSGHRYQRDCMLFD